MKQSLSNFGDERHCAGEHNGLCKSLVVGEIVVRASASLVMIRDCCAGECKFDDGRDCFVGECNFGGWIDCCVDECKLW